MTPRRQEQASTRALLAPIDIKPLPLLPLYRPPFHHRRRRHHIFQLAEDLALEILEVTISKRYRQRVFAVAQYGPNAAANLFWDDWRTDYMRMYFWLLDDRETRCCQLKLNGTSGGAMPHDHMVRRALQMELRTRIVTALDEGALTKEPFRETAEHRAERDLPVAMR